MEEFFRGVSEKIKQQVQSIGAQIEEERRLMTIRSFECMADCFKQKIPIQEAGMCADRCGEPMNEIQSLLDNQNQNIQNSLNNCIQGCTIKAKNDEDAAKQCITQCTDKAIEEFSAFKLRAKEVIKSYL